MLAKDTLHKLIAFGVVGIVGTSTHYLLLISFVEVADLDPVVATSIGFVGGAAVNYLLNYRYTFRSAKSHLDASLLAPKLADSR
jgi:putative flippase GtrA